MIKRFHAISIAFNSNIMDNKFVNICFIFFNVHRVDGEDVRLMLWDTAGQEEFDAITAAYYRGAHACVLAYSATDRDSFDAIPSWKLKV